MLGGYTKVYHEILGDPKMGLLSDHLFRRAIEFMLAAGVEGRGGPLPPTSELAWTLRTTEAEVIADLETLAGPGIRITQMTSDGWIVVNYAKRQGSGNNTGAERQARWRAKQEAKRLSLGSNASDASHNALRNVTVTGEEEKKERNKEDSIANAIGDSSPQPKPPKKAKSVKEPKQPEHEAITAYRQVTLLTPKPAIREMIIDAVTDIETWRKAVIAWNAKGHNPKNIDGMLDWYRNGIPPSGPKGNGKPAASEPAGFAGIRDYIADREAKNAARGI